MKPLKTKASYRDPSWLAPSDEELLALIRRYATTDQLKVKRGVNYLEVTITFVKP